MHGTDFIAFNDGTLRLFDNNSVDHPEIVPNFRMNCSMNCQASLSSLFQYTEKKKSGMLK